MKRFPKLPAAIALALMLALPLAACAGAPQPGGEEAASDSGQAVVSFDVSSAKTLGDVIAAGELKESSWDDKHYVCLYMMGDTPILAAAEFTDEASKQMDELEFDDPDYDEKLASIIGPLPLTKIEDLSDEKLSDEEIQGYIGKTGQDLMDEGFTCTGYSMYGGEQTMADMDKGNIRYWVTLDGTVEESQIDDKGASITGYKVVSIEFEGASASAMDPSLL